MAIQSLIPLAQGPTRTIFEWGRIQSNVDWLWVVLALAAAALYIRWLYRRDSVELSPLLSWFLTGLRVTVLVALALVFLQPQWRTEREVTHPSRALLLVDTSLSMGLSDEIESASDQNAMRADPLISAIADSDLIPTIKSQHEVAVWRFDEIAEPVTRYEKAGSDLSLASDVAESGDEEADEVDVKVDFHAALAPRGAETRLGEALHQLLDDNRGAPVSGMVVFSDGGQNAGLGPTDACKLAREMEIPIHVVGIGSNRQPTNVRVRDVVAPARVYPGDHYSVTAYLQAQGMTGEQVTVELWSRRGTSSAPVDDDTPGTLEGTETVAIDADGEVTPVTFDLLPGEAGTRTLDVRVKTARNDNNPADDRQEVDVEVVDRQTRVLLFAGGPTREYQFLRTVYHRDPHVMVDVLLQTAQPGLSQEAHRILDTFPSTPEAMFEYDAIAALDPNWLVLDNAQVDLLERWVAEQAGGMIVVAGPIYLNHWTQSAAMNKIRALYPVEFNRQLTLLDSDRYGATEPWPIEFSRAGYEAEFLWLDETAARSRQVWDQSPGVFGYYDVRGAKPGAVVYATFSDPRAAGGGDPPVYVAGQFYGSGRVLYFGSGELWRLRSLNPAYYERLATQLVRYVSQGRLLRGSSRGMLLMERDRYLLGQTVVVRAQLSNAQLDPLDASRVSLYVSAPDGQRKEMTLAADAARPGTFTGQLTVRQEGIYRVELPIPESNDERIVRRIQVRVPDLERENPQRNDALLSEIASSTGGVYFTDLETALGVGDSEGVAALLKDRSKTDVLSDAPEPLWDNVWVLVAICGLLSVEWLVRRLVRLA